MKGLRLKLGGLITDGCRSCIHNRTRQDVLVRMLPVDGTNESMTTNMA